MFAISADIDDNARDKALHSLKTVEAEFLKIGLTIQRGDQQKRWWSEWKKKFHVVISSGLSTQVMTIENLFAKELRRKLFLYIPPERSRFWPRGEQPRVFGEAVHNCFPSVENDVLNASVCLAISQPTAAVFHLMRALEIALAALGKKFEVSLEHTNWGPAIEQIESRIRDMHKHPKWKALPDCKDQQHYYAQAARESLRHS